MACNSHKVCDQEEIEKHKQWVIDKIVDQMEQEQVGIEALSRIMGEKLELLNLKLQSSDKQSAPSEQVEENEKTQKSEKTDSGYRPESKDMPAKLAEERKPVSKLIMEDCVQLGLLSRKRAKYLISQMAGKQPAEAEKEVVTELRTNLHKQVRVLIRKDKNGPWAAPKSQEELRLEIAQTPTVRSMVYLTKDIFKERDDWINRSKKSITGRIFGSRLTVNKK
ncbi:MAG: hypothetical protein GY777_00340 [Candidatus Brocadiaceae bacterium]|nr:hypothetical protein [Candidatus Brocadiaceae bacterium]